MATAAEKLIVHAALQDLHDKGLIKHFAFEPYSKHGQALEMFDEWSVTPHGTDMPYRFNYAEVRAYIVGVGDGLRISLPTG